MVRRSLGCNGSAPRVQDGPSTVLVTGAGGFVGRAFVRAALADGHRVRAVLRRGVTLERHHANLSVHPVGLEDVSALAPVLDGVDAVVHVAAALCGDGARQHADTVVATERLLEAMTDAAVFPLVGVGSFAVYDVSRLADGSTLDEDTPVYATNQGHSVYANAKLAQEALFRGFGATVLRPAVVYSDERPWTAVLGRALGDRLWLRAGPDAEVPLVHVDDVARALLSAVRRQPMPGTPLNLVEDELPRRWALVRALAHSRAPARRVVGVPWAAHRAVARWAGRLHGMPVGQRLPLPALLDPARVEANFKPLRYSNRRARQLLGWRPERRALECATPDRPEVHRDEERVLLQARPGPEA